MVADIVADMKMDIVADMEVDKVADKEGDMVTDRVADNIKKIGRHGVGHGGRYEGRQCADVLVMSEACDVSSVKMFKISEL